MSITKPTPPEPLCDYTRHDNVDAERQQLIEFYESHIADICAVREDGGGTVDNDELLNTAMRKIADRLMVGGLSPQERSNALVDIRVIIDHVIVCPTYEINQRAHGVQAAQAERIEQFIAMQDAGPDEPWSKLRDAVAASIDNHVDSQWAQDHLKDDINAALSAARAAVALLRLKSPHIVCDECRGWFPVDGMETLTVDPESPPQCKGCIHRRELAEDNRKLTQALEGGLAEAIERGATSDGKAAQAQLAGIVNAIDAFLDTDVEDGSLRAWLREWSDYQKGQGPPPESPIAPSGG